MNVIRNWLEAIGLSQYADAFEANDIDMDLVGQVDDQTLKDIGVSSAGHRLRIRNAISKLSPRATLDTRENVPTAVERTSAERRQLTVMFCDLVGSTALSARLDPEDLRAVIGAYHRCAAGVIERIGGFVAKYMGDGVLAYFGYPRADEHDAERAVRAGLALVEAVAGLDTPAETRLQVRIGIATGPVGRSGSVAATRRTRCARHSSPRRSKTARSSRTSRKPPNIATQARRSSMIDAATIRRKLPAFLRRIRMQEREGRLRAFPAAAVLMLAHVTTALAQTDRSKALFAQTLRIEG
jgi:hypothetical protein